MVVDELPAFRSKLRQLLGNPTCSRREFEDLFAAHRFPDVDVTLRARKRRCRVANTILATWPTTEKQITHQFGDWQCTESEYVSGSLEWCPTLNTLILRVQQWNERGPVGRGFIAPHRAVWYHLLTTAEAIDRLLADRERAQVPTA